MALREVLAEFNIVVNDDQLKGLEGRLKKGQDRLAQFGKSFAAVAAARAVKAFIENAADAGAQITRLSTRLGISTGDVQRFGYMAGQSGVDMDSAARAATFLEKSLGQAAMGNKSAAKVFGELGVNIRDSSGHVRNFESVLPEVAEGIKKLGSEGEQTAATVKLFGRNGAELLPLLMQGKEGVAALSKEFDELHLEVSKTDLNTLTKLRQQLDKNKLGFQAMGMAIVAKLAPALMHLLTGNAARWMKAFAEETRVVTFALGAFAIAAGVKASMAIANLAGNFAKFAVRDPILTATVVALAIMALALEDIYGFSKGEKSVTGAFLAKFMTPEEVENFRKNTQDVVKGIEELIAAVGPGAVKAISWFGKTTADAFMSIALAAEAAVQAIKGHKDVAGELFDESGKRAEHFVNQFNPDAPPDEPEKKPGRKLGPAGSVFGGKAPLSPEMLAGEMPSGLRPVDPGLPPPLPPRGSPGSKYAGPPTSSAGPITQNNNTTVNVTVPPGSDLPAAGKAMTESLKGAQKDHADALAAVQNGGR